MLSPIGTRSNRNTISNRQTRARKQACVVSPQQNLAVDALSPQIYASKGSGHGPSRESHGGYSINQKCPDWPLLRAQLQHHLVNLMGSCTVTSCSIGASLENGRKGIETRGGAWVGLLAFKSLSVLDEPPRSAFVVCTNIA